MELDRYLTRRNGGTVWYARVPVPRHLHAIVGKTNIWKSLRTEDKSDATVRAVKFVEQLRRDWDRLSNGVDDALGRAPAALTDELLERTAVRYAYDLLLDQMDRQRQSLAHMSDADFQSYCDQRQSRLLQRQKEVATGNLEGVKAPARGIVARERWDLDEADPRFQRFCEYLAQANLATFKTHSARLQGNIHAESDDRIIRRVRAREAERAPNGESVSALVERYTQAKLREGRKRRDTIEQDQKLLSMFAAFVGENRRPAAVTKQQAREFRDTLFGIPVSMTKRKDYRGLSMQEAAAKAQRDGAPTLDIRTVAKHISTVSPFYGWLVREGYAEANPFDGLHPSTPKEKRRRPPFDTQQLNTLLKSPLFTGYAADGKEHEAGEVRTRDWRFWIPLVCMFTGARIGEIAQLHIEDVHQRDGYWFVLIKEDEGQGQQTKNRKQRLVAVHPTLERIGFVEFAQRARSERSIGPLFGGVGKNDRGQAGRASRFFRDYLSKIGIKSKGERDGFGSHSFRHLLADQLRDADYMDAEFGPLIFGHGSAAPITSGYGTRTQGTLNRRYSMIESVQFNGVEFEHLIEVPAPSKVNRVNQVDLTAIA